MAHITVVSLLLISFRQLMAEDAPGRQNLTSKLAGTLGHHMFGQVSQAPAFPHAALNEVISGKLDERDFDLLVARLKRTMCIASEHVCSNGVKVFGHGQFNSYLKVFDQCDKVADVHKALLGPLGYGTTPVTVYVKQIQSLNGYPDIKHGESATEYEVDPSTELMSLCIKEPGHGCKLDLYFRETVPEDKATKVKVFAHRDTMSGHGHSLKPVNVMKLFDKSDRVADVCKALQDALGYTGVSFTVFVKQVNPLHEYQIDLSTELISLCSKSQGSECKVDLFFRETASEDDEFKIKVLVQREIVTSSGLKVLHALKVFNKSDRVVDVLKAFVGPFGYAGIPVLVYAKQRDSLNITKNYLVDVDAELIRLCTKRQGLDCKVDLLIRDTSQVLSGAESLTGGYPPPYTTSPIATSLAPTFGNLGSSQVWGGADRPGGGFDGPLRSPDSVFVSPSFWSSVASGSTSATPVFGVGTNANTPVFGVESGSFTFVDTGASTSVASYAGRQGSGAFLGLGWTSTTASPAASWFNAAPMIR